MGMIMCHFCIKETTLINTVQCAHCGKVIATDLRINDMYRMHDEAMKLAYIRFINKEKITLYMIIKRFFRMRKLDFSYLVFCVKEYLG